MNYPLFSRVMAFLQRETQALDRKLLVMTVAAGTADALVLAAINAGVGALVHGGPNWRHFMLFTLSMGLFSFTFRYTLHESSRISEEAVRSIRLRLTHKIRGLDLQVLESIGEAEIRARVCRDTAVISQTLPLLFAAAQSMVMGLFTLLYIAVISPTAGLLCLAIIGLGAGVNIRDRKAAEDGLREASRQDDAFATSLDGLVHGFKELRINRLKSADAYGELQTAADRVRDVRIRVMQQFSDSFVFLDLFFMGLLGSIVFVLPVLSPAFAPSVAKIVASVIFLTGPLYSVFKMIPMLAQVNETVDKLERMEARLDQGLAQSAAAQERPLEDLDFQSIRCEGLGFSYRVPGDSASFQIGPIDLELRRGETLFLVGDNGSGKTTLLKLMTALYHPMEGCIRVDGEEILTHNRQSYQNLFSAIFSDFHLFDKLHGLRGMAPERVNALLRQMNLFHKTEFRDGGFSSIALSTGQRKRLALVVSYLEDKAIHVFDEVAADQDPSFRAYYYETLLPEMKRAGKTVLVVTHDDRYFHLADRVFTMDYGKLTQCAQ